MDQDIQELVKAIHNTLHHIVLVIAGAGNQAIADLLGVPGATRTVLEVLVPYSTASFDEFLGQSPSQYVAASTARLMAGRALTRARWLESQAVPLVGVACTATIVTDRPKKGEHRAHIALWQEERLICHSLFLDKGARDRTGEDSMVSRLILNGLAYACGLQGTLPLALHPGDRLETAVSDFAAYAQKVHQGELSYFAVQDHGRIRTDDIHPRVILSGSFNPLHKGHLALARAASTLLKRPVTFELPAINADKPPLPPEVVVKRIAQFAGRYPILVSNAPTFVAKARLFPQATFVVGVDTTSRILHSRFYEGSVARRDAALEEIQQLGCRFLVAGRVDKQGSFFHIDALQIPPRFTELFILIPASDFRVDISSSELRSRGQKGSR